MGDVELQKRVDSLQRDLGAIEDMVTKEMAAAKNSAAAKNLLALSKNIANIKEKTRVQYSMLPWMVRLRALVKRVMWSAMKIVGSVYVDAVLGETGKRGVRKVAHAVACAAGQMIAVGRYVTVIMVRVLNVLAMVWVLDKMYGDVILSKVKREHVVLIKKIISELRIPRYLLPSVMRRL